MGPHLPDIKQDGDKYLVDVGIEEIREFKSLEDAEAWTKEAVAGLAIFSKLSVANMREQLQKMGSGSGSARTKDALKKRYVKFLVVPALGDEAKTAGAAASSAAEVAAAAAAAAVPSSATVPAAAADIEQLAGAAFEKSTSASKAIEAAEDNGLPAGASSSSSKVSDALLGEAASEKKAAAPPQCGVGCSKVMSKKGSLNLVLPPHFAGCFAG